MAGRWLSLYPFQDSLFFSLFFRLFDYYYFFLFFFRLIVNTFEFVWKKTARFAESFHSDFVPEAEENTFFFKKKNFFCCCFGGKLRSIVCF